MRYNVNKLIFGTLAVLALLVATTSFGVQAQQVPGRSTSGILATVATPTPAAKRTQAASPIRAQAEWILGQNSDMVRVPLDKIVSVKLPGKVRNVIIGNPTIANVVGPNDGTRDHIYVLALLVGSTSIIFEDGQGNILYKGDIQVDLDVAGIQSAITEMIPEEKIEVSAQRNTVFLKGFVRSPIASTQAVNVARRFVTDNLNIVNNLEVLGSRQVIMKVHISEIKRTTIKELGFDFTYTKDIGNRANNLTLKTAASAILGSTNTAFVTGTILPAITGFGSISYRVLEQSGLAKTLAEPNLTAISGETATFLSGKTFFQQSGVDSNGNPVYAEKEVGVRLSFTPTIMDKGQINLHIATEISEADNANKINGFPTINKNRTETIVDLPSGGSLIISGLIQNNQNNKISGVPGLKDLPILGALFRSEAFSKNETELVVIVEAYLAEPVGNSARLALPTDGFITSSDLDLYLLGQLHKQYTKVPLPPYATPLAGPYGYIME